MKKRRVLAFLLALSLTVGTNGMTVLATEDGGTAVAEIVPEETVTDETQAESDQTDSEDSAEEEQKQDEADMGAAAEDGTGEDGLTDQEADNNETPDSETADGNAADADNAAPGDVENDAEDASDPADGIDSEEPEETSDVADDSILPDIIHEVRMVTFTDDTGMRITYDANASQQYIYTVEGGVLTKVERLTGEGETKEPVIFTGNVELTQPAEEEQQYTSIAAEIFAGNTDITYVKLPSGITTVTAGSFKGCTALKSVYLPATVTAIGESAFESCTAMSQIAVPKTTESIGNSAFKGDTKLYMVYAKDADYSSLASIGDHAFDGCIVLAEFCSDTEFRLPTNVANIGEYAFHNCKSIAEIDLNAANLTTMGEYAFAGCTGLTDAIMNKSLPTIPKHAFDGCIALASLTFTSKSGQWVKIDEYAFYGCYSLKQLVLPGTISEVADYAFAGCTNLHRIEVKNDNLIIGKIRPFPVGETKNTLLFVGSVPSTIYDYYRTTDAGKNKVAFEKTNARNYYKYTVEDSNGVEHADGKVPGGQIWIGTKESASYGDNINTLNNGQGVYNDDNVKYCVYLKADSGYTLVAGSVRANGETLQKDQEGYYYIAMPLGGIVITAEFSQNTTERVEGQEKDIAVEFSNGELIMSGEEAIGVKIKVGQTTRMFLIDKSGVPVAASKIKEMKSNKESVAKVSGTGVITAVGRGTAFIRASLIGGDGGEIVIQRRVDVVEAEVDTIKIKASEYDTLITITGDPDGIQTASVDKNVVRNEGLSITLRANAYTSDKEGISKDLTWKTSDSKIASLNKASTTGADAVNVVEIQPGCEGEATITVTAKNSGNEDKPTVTQKFVVSVQDKTVKLAYKSITVNPNLEDGGELEVLPAYGGAITPNGTRLYELEKDGQGKERYSESTHFLTPVYKGAGSGKSYRYSVIPTPDTEERTYKVYVCFNGKKPEESTPLPLTITVKKSKPAPTVKFNTKKTKFNLFYKNGGTDKDGNPITVTAEVSKLGTAKIKKFELQPLSTKDNDKLFLENFEIVDNPEELAKNTVTIRRKAGDLKYTSGKKAAVTGYLVIYYEGYSDAVAKKVKVTMPTATTAPSYVLDRTSVTYRDIVSSAQQETLTLLDKKTKKPIELDSTRNRIDVDTDISAVNSWAIDADGDITFGMSYPEKGKIKFILQSDEWNADKEGKPRTLTYTFTVKISDKEPTVKTDQKTVTLNAAYPENKAYFRLVSNQSDTALDETQRFDYNHNAPNASEYSKMSVNYSDGLGTVEIIEPNANIKAGTYTWTAYPVEKNGNVLAKKTTLTVKVVKTPPVVKFGKGSLSLNLATGMSPDNQNVIYTETASIPFTITGQPEGYELDTNVNTGGECTTIVCTTSNESGREDRFSWSLEGVKKVDDKLVDGKLAVSLKSGVASKTYTFKMTQRYVNSSNGNAVLAKPITFKVKVYSNSDISVSLAAKGKLNLVDREGEYTSKNSIIYTPTLKNVKGVITDAKIYDVETNSESKYFDIYLNPENGKLYVTPKKIKVSTPGDPDTGKPDDNVPGDGAGSGDNVPGSDAGPDDTVSGNDVESGGSLSENDTKPDGSVSGNDTKPDGSVSGNDTKPDGSVSGNDTEPGSGSSGSGTDLGGNTPGGDTEPGGDSSGGSTEPGGNTPGSDVKSEYLYAGLENNKEYKVKIWVGVEGYSGRDGSGGVLSKPIVIKTAQTLPKVTKSKSTLDVFLSNKGYDASFVVTPKAGSAGQIESIHFGEKDLISQDTFQILYERQKDGSLKVIVHLKEAVAYACDSTNQVKMYVRFKGQGTNTDGTPITMNIRINK